MVKHFLKIFSTFFYIGYLPFIPGTFGSLAGLLLFILLKGMSVQYISLTGLIILVGFLVCGRVEKIMQRKDPPCIIIDEVAGMMLSLIFLPHDLKLAFTGFIIFRILDTLKPFPAGRLEKKNSGGAIMLDDLVAGLYTNIILQVALRVISFKAS